MGCVVTILDISSVKQTENGKHPHHQHKGDVAHFVAHSKAIVAMAWDSSDSLLLTLDKLGNNFNLFRVVAHPLGFAFATVHHLKTVFRTDTPGSMQEGAFLPDSHWMKVSTLRRTIHRKISSQKITSTSEYPAKKISTPRPHMFPICPYGGSVGVRTHTSHRVVNKLS